MRILILLSFIVTGVLVELYVFPLVRFLGRMNWAEVKFGAGGTFFAWRLIGLILIIGSLFAYRYLNIF